MLKIVQKTSSYLNALRCNHPQIIVMYSGGKDSLALMDLVLKEWEPKNVLACTMEIVNGMENTKLIKARMNSYFGNIRHVSVKHFQYYAFKLIGRYCLTDMSLYTKTPITINHIMFKLMKENNIDLVVKGDKRCDSIIGAKKLNKENQERVGIHCPLWDWTQNEVRAYCAYKGHEPIKYKEVRKGQSSGMDLNKVQILDMYDNNASDYERIEREFPLVRAVVAQRDYFPELFKG